MFSAVAQLSNTELLARVTHLAEREREARAPDVPLTEQPRRRSGLGIIAATRSGPSTDPGRSAALPSRGERPNTALEQTAEAGDFGDAVFVSGL